MNLKNKITSAIAAATLLGGGIISVVKHNEGYSESAYQDGAGVWTICYGDTRGVKRGMRLTMDVCDAQLRDSIAEHTKALAGLPESTPDVVILGSIDMAYNIGVSGFSTSTQKKHLLNGDYNKAGYAVLSWRYITLPNGVKYDCSQLVHGKPNKVCWGLWERRQWQSKAIGNTFKSVQEALDNLPK
ncbi:putative endolysin [Dickeya phage BF25/12]|uniref:Lysozyme n=1 Tax=Dickeya phage BF25/12 TaxID=1698708 RepID=A0A219MH17_9CAUD|nr:putative endolysin [Dickeya phage BF25/12]ALA46465.1 putative endolysin [Dickeya phage BF25/12]